VKVADFEESFGTDKRLPRYPLGASFKVLKEAIA